MDQIDRLRLRRRYAAAEPRVLWLQAAAGFGKTTLARMWLREIPKHLAIVCRGASHRAIVCSLADTLGIGYDDDTSADALQNAVLERWICADVLDAVFLDELDRLEEPAARALVEELLRSIPPGRTVFVATRTMPALRLSRWFQPQDILRFGAHDLRFDAQEMAQVFAGTALSPEDLETIARVTAGWPVAALVLLRYVRTLENERFVADLDALPFDDLRDYLFREVIDSLPPNRQCLLAVCAALKEVAIGELRAVFPTDNVEEVARDLLELPFLVGERGGGHLVARALARTALHDARGEPLRRQLQATTSEFIRTGMYVAAAEILLELGEQREAVVVLDRPSIEAVAFRDRRVLDAIAMLDVDVLLGHPRLFRPALTYRRQHDDARLLYDDMLRLLTTAESADDRSLLHLAMATIARQRGHLWDAERHLKEVYREAEALQDAGGAGISKEIVSAARAQRALLDLQRGRWSEATRTWRQLCGEVDVEEALPLDAFEFDLWQPLYEGAWKERSRELLSRFNHLCEHCDRSILVHVARQFRLVAWLFGDDGILNSIADALRPESDVIDDTAQRASESLPRHALIAEILQAARKDVRALDELATKVARSEQPFVALLYRLAMFVAMPDRANAVLLEDVLAPIESSFLRMRIGEIIANAAERSLYGILAPEGSAESASHGERIRLDVLDRRVLMGEREIPLSDLSFALMVALALADGECTREDLAEMLWGDLAPVSQMNALKSCVHRTRVQLSRTSAIESTPRGYRLGAVAVDVIDLEKEARALAAAPTGALSLEHAVAVVEALCRPLPEVVRRYEWSERLAVRITNAVDLLADRIAREAIEHGDHQAVRRVADALQRLDPCSEHAAALLIRSALRRKDRIGAQRYLRRYRELLRRELGVEPSEELEQLLLEATGGEAPTTGDATHVS